MVTIWVITRSRRAGSFSALVKTRLGWPRQELRTVNKQDSEGLEANVQPDAVPLLKLVIPKVRILFLQSCSLLMRYDTTGYKLQRLTTTSQILPKLAFVNCHLLKRHWK